MKYFKKIIAASVLAFSAFTLFAQTSNTSQATYTLFTTDVDNYMNVLTWSSVKPEKGFGLFGVSSNSYQLGFAKQFENFYWGTYFTGDFGTYSKTVNKTAASTSTEIFNGTDDDPAKTDDTTSFTFYNLFGKGNLGVRVGFKYANAGSTLEDNGVTSDSNDKTVWSIYTRAGLQNVSLFNRDVKVYGFANFDFNPDNGTKTVTDSEVTADNRNWDLYFGLGGTTVLSQTEKVVSKYTASLGCTITNPVNKDFNKASKTNISLTPFEYRIIYSPTQKFSAGVRAQISSNIYFGKADEDTSTFGLSVTPNLYAGLQYDTLKKVVFNTGFSFAIPKYELDTSDNSATNIKITTSSWNGSDGSITTWTGFQFNPIKNLSFDCIWDVWWDLFGTDLTTDFTEGAGTPSDPEPFWGNLNKLFVHNISLKISYKF